MKKTLLAISLLLSIQFISAQDYQRKIFDYASMNRSDSTRCTDQVYEETDRIFGMIDQLQSKAAVAAAKELFDKGPRCPEAFEIYSWALFRSGEWMKASALIDSAIGIYGVSNPYLVIRRGYMNAEMAEMGTGAMNIDGNSVYKAQNQQLPFEEANFKKENYKAALADLKFIADNYENRPEEIYATGYLYQQTGEYDNSTDYFIKLLSNEEYGDRVIFPIVDNLIGQKKYESAEISLQNLEKKYPRSPEIQKKFAELYELENNKDKQKLAQMKQEYYSWMPEYCDLPYSAANYDALQYFAGDVPGKKKIKDLKAIVKSDQATAIDMLIAILNMHANHGNGVEEQAAKMLSKIGSPAVPKVILLLQNAPSTCTVTDAAGILADVKDPAGWQPMLDYLPKMLHMPMTLIPPNVPEQIIRFDRARALPALLEWLKPEIAAEELSPGDPMDGLGNIFASGSIYAPLASYKKEEVRKAAADLHYSDQQTAKLMEKVYGK
jgi:hypothetical protein